MEDGIWLKRLKKASWKMRAPGNGDTGDGAPGNGVPGAGYAPSTARPYLRRADRGRPPKGAVAGKIHNLEDGAGIISFGDWEASPGRLPHRREPEGPALSAPSRE